MTQSFYEGLPWKIHRNSHGWPRWWQGWYEVWLVLSGKYTFWHAYDQGKHDGSASEYRRIVVNGGDLTPVLDAAIYATSAHILNGQEPQAETMQQIRRKAWLRYEQDRSAVLQMLTARSLNAEE